MNRVEMIAKHISIKDSKILEIGALDSPTFTKQESDIKYVDYDSKFNLHYKNKENPRYSLDKLVEVDFICSTPTYSNIIKEKFDLIIANHVIEHIPDTISWLQELSNMLNDSGHIFLSVPDKRYTFDIMRTESTIIDLISNFHDKIKKPTFKHIFEHFYFYKNISAKDVWLNQYKDLLKKDRYTLENTLKVATTHAKLPYADVHCHVFTFDSLYSILLELMNLKYFKLTIEDFQNVNYMKNEFHLLLKKHI